MGRTIRTTTLALLASVLMLAVGSAGVAQARTAQSTAAAPCLGTHVNAVVFCHAVEHRIAIRTVRQLAMKEAKRANVKYRPGHYLGWRVPRLMAANHWERSRLAFLRKLPTFIRIRAMGSWVCIHQHEGAWNDTGDPYWGGLQMDYGFMTTYGMDMIRRHHGGLANTWTPYEQMLVAQRAYDSGRGFGPWPNTRIPCGV